jgi:hypothetical protein
MLQAVVAPDVESDFKTILMKARTGAGIGCAPYSRGRPMAYAFACCSTAAATSPYGIVRSRRRFSQPGGGFFGGSTTTPSQTMRRGPAR